MNWRPGRPSVCTVLQACCLSLGLAVLAPSTLTADRPKSAGDDYKDAVSDFRSDCK